MDKCNPVFVQPVDEKESVLKKNNPTKTTNMKTHEKYLMRSLIKHNLNCHPHQNFKSSPSKMNTVNSLYEYAYRGDYETVKKHLDENPKLIDKADGVRKTFIYFASHLRQFSYFGTMPNGDYRYTVIIL